jgi:hypothetical protein
MPKPLGRPPGLLLHAEAFEAILAGRGLLKKDVAVDAGITASFLADLLAHRGGASRPVAERLAGTLGVKVAALFPETAGWVGPLPDRESRRQVAS